MFLFPFIRLRVVLLTCTNQTFKFINIYSSLIYSSIFIFELPSTSLGVLIRFKTVLESLESSHSHLLIWVQQSITHGDYSSYYPGGGQLYHMNRFQDTPLYKFTTIIWPQLYHNINFSIRSTQIYMIIWSIDQIFPWYIKKIAIIGFNLLLEVSEASL